MGPHTLRRIVAKATQIVRWNNRKCGKNIASGHAFSLEFVPVGVAAEMLYRSAIKRRRAVPPQVISAPRQRQRPHRHAISLPLLIVGGIVAISPAALHAQAFTPSTLRQAYGLNLLSANTTGSGQTIAIIDAYSAIGTTNLDNDVNQFDTAFGLPALTPTIESQTGGSTSSLSYNSGWAQETTLDVEYAHALAPDAKIEVFEAKNASYHNLLGAASYAAAHGASVVSMSFAGGEAPSFDSSFSAGNTSPGQSGVTFVASTGDDGSAGGVPYPAANPYVVAVGGTSLTLNSNGSYAGETAWSGSGGGTSAYELRPSYQNSVQSSAYRTVPDVAFDADPSTGVDIIFGGNTVQVGGTSVGSPCWAGLFALADQQRVANGLPALSSLQALDALYGTYNTPEYSTIFHDITSGSDGTYSAGTGYDEVTGLGSPIANELVDYLGTYPEPEPATGSLALLVLPLLLTRRRRSRRVPSKRQPTEPGRPRPDADAVRSLSPPRDHATSSRSGRGRPGSVAPVHGVAR
jgi:hypothetical protein